jgi:hypothetical protein
MPKAIAASTRDTLLCPSSQPGVEGARVLGIMQQFDGRREVTYLDEALPAAPDVLAMAAPLHPTEIFRLAAQCQTDHCPHFDGANCGLVTRIVQILPAMTEELPKCQIRAQCRWFHQEGIAACRRCPQISTVNYDASETLQKVIQFAPPENPAADLLLPSAPSHPR